MHILTISDFYPPFIGGAEHQVSLICRNLKQRGHTVNVATVWQGETSQVTQDEYGVTVYRLKSLSTRVPWFYQDPRRRFHPPFPDIGMAFSLRRLIETLRPDIVHAVGWIAYSVAVALRNHAIPLVVSTRDHGYTCAIRVFLHNGRVCSGPSFSKCLDCSRARYGWPKALAAVSGVFWGRSLLRKRIDAYHCASTYIYDLMRRDLFDGAVERKPHGVVIPNILANEAAPGGLPDVIAALSQPYILFVGALQPSKGLDVLLAAHQALVSPPPLVLVGTAWPDTPTRFPPGVTVLRDLPHPVVMAAWQRSLFAVVPSLIPETFGNAVVEAMSQGKAVIASRLGSLANLVKDEETGFLVPPGDVLALTQAMQCLLDDAEKRQRFGRAGYERSQLFSAETIVPQFEAFYQRLTV
ncbi:MAG: glycosyltransferase family 4 protein [Chloroflexota bacterium]